MPGQSLITGLTLLAAGLRFGDATPLPGSVNLAARSDATPVPVSVNLAARPDACEQKYTEHEDKVEGSYIVNFTAPYTLQDHFDFLQEEFNVVELNTGYHADLTADQLAKVRTDCSVQFVEDDTFGPNYNDIGDLEEESGPTRRVRRGEQKDAP